MAYKFTNQKPLIIVNRRPCIRKIRLLIEMVIDALAKFVASGKFDTPPRTLGRAQDFIIV